MLLGIIIGLSLIPIYVFVLIVLAVCGVDIGSVKPKKLTKENMADWPPPSPGTRLQ